MTNPVVDVFPPDTVAALHDVEVRLQAQAISREPQLQEWTTEPLAAGGKRVRPLLLLTSFSACGGDLAARAGEHARDAAVALELVHTASLVHDDLMDGAGERRGQPSTFAAHGVEGAILVGDYLFTQAFALAATLPKDALAMTADACRRLCEGQLREQVFQESGSNDRDTYLSVIRDKTSAVLSAACGIGASLAGGDEDTIEDLRGYGDAIGNAFQVLDDVLDVTGDPKWTGKPSGTDYLAGTLSSPYLHHLQRGGRLPTKRDAGDFPDVRRALYESGAIATSQLDASTHTQAALLRLGRLAPSPARRSLEQLAVLLMERVQ